jgi:hypothetical protein
MRPPTSHPSRVVKDGGGRGDRFVQCMVERLERSRWASYGLGEERSMQVVVDWAVDNCAVLGDSLSVSWGYPDYAPPTLL